MLPPEITVLKTERSERFSPPKEIHTLFLHDHLEDFLRLIPLQFILRKEEHTDSIISLRTQKMGWCIWG